ncbi:hypothetical protein TNCV_114071 [Trichonephila clavipes]|nr:hypothetical protein TNCV_114071 [Trichonephila clavipes]
MLPHPRSYLELQDFRKTLLNLDALLPMKRENNSTQQQERTTQLGSRNEQLNSRAGTKQLNSAVGTKQLNSALHCRRSPATAYNRLQPPATACTAFTAESAFSTYSC